MRGTLQRQVTVIVGLHKMMKIMRKREEMDTKGVSNEIKVWHISHTPYVNTDMV